MKQINVKLWVSNHVFLIYILTPGVISWSQTLPTGTVSYTSTYCTSMETFQASLVGKQTTSITIGAGGSSYSCTDATTAKQITNAFSTCTTTCSSQSFSCNGVNWWVGKCGPGGEIGIGTAICSCTGTISIRPCINNNNWGGLGSNTCGQSSQTLNITVKYSGKYYNLTLKRFIILAATKITFPIDN